MSLVCFEIKKGVVFEGENISRKFLIIERWVQIAMWSVSRNVLHATESEYTSEEQPSICIDYNSLEIDHYHTIYFRKI